MGFSRQEYWSGLPFPSLEAAGRMVFLIFVIKKTRGRAWLAGVERMWRYPIGGSVSRLWSSEREVSPENPDLVIGIELVFETMQLNSFIQGEYSRWKRGVLAPCSEMLQCLEAWQQRKNHQGRLERRRQGGKLPGSADPRGQRRSQRSEEIPELRVASSRGVQIPEVRGDPRTQTSQERTTEPNATGVLGAEDRKRGRWLGKAEAAVTLLGWNGSGADGRQREGARDSCGPKGLALRVLRV